MTRLEPRERDDGSTTVCLSLAPTPNAERISVVGDFTAWTPVDMPFDGHAFSIYLVLPRSNRWRYRFLVDERSWLNDPEAHELEHGADGQDMSILTT